MPGVNQDSRYYASTAVFISEIMKLVFCSFYAISEQGLTEPFEQIFHGDWWKLSIPALLYTLQNNLQYVAVSNLEAVTFQVMHQLKILSTALFSVIILRRSLSRGQWAALFLLTFGVALIQIPESTFMELKDLIYGLHDTGAKRQASNKPSSETAATASMNPLVGVMAIVTASIISGLSGVYFEKVLKTTNNVSVWVRNIQLSIFSLIPCLVLGVYFKDGSGIAKNGFLHGYNSVVWTSVSLQALGGIVVSLSVKYADNIAKNFATSISIILSFLASVLFFNFAVSVNFVFGVMTVLTSTYMYSHQGTVAAPKHDPYYEKSNV
jgi:UDP-sugar transporter A1/2/3